MNPKIRKAIDDIERTKAKIAELEALLPELERKRIELENNEIIRIVRSANVAPENLSDFIEAFKSKNTNTPPTLPLNSAARQEVIDNENE